MWLNQIFKNYIIKLIEEEAENLNQTKMKDQKAKSKWKWEKMDQKFKYLLYNNI